jgi:hypothetical protein
MDMRRVHWLALSVLLLLVGCGRGGAELPGVSVELGIGPNPPEVGPATLLVTLQDSAGAPLEKAQVEIEGNMNHAGMVPVLAQAVEVEPGRYEAAFEFTMAGDWFILIRAKLADGRSGEWKKDVPGVLWVTP